MGGRGSIGSMGGMLLLGSVVLAGEAGEGLVVELGHDAGGDGAGVGVFEDFAFEIAQGDAAGAGVDEVVGVDRDFATAAGTINDKLGYGIAGGVAAQAFDDIDAFRDGGAEVGGAGDEVALVEVVRPDAAHQ